MLLASHFDLQLVIDWLLESVTSSAYWTGQLAASPCNTSLETPN